MKTAQKTPYKVLVVDDTPDNIQLISDILFEEGMSVTIARSGKQALKNVLVKLPDIILLDIAMPEMDGYEVCETLKKTPATANIPVIFLTAKTEAADVIKGFQVGAVDYVTKPFNIAELVARVHTHLELKRSRDIINEQNEKLKQLDATKDKFFSILASDLKFPFRAMYDLIRQSVNNIDKLQISEIKRTFLSLHSFSEKSSVLLDKLHEWSQLLTEKTQFKPRRFDIDLVIKNNVELFKNSAKEKTINILYEKPHTQMVMADQNLTDSILKNLIQNAIKFTDNGGDIIISTKDDNDFVEVTVYDTGTGINPDVKALLFRSDTFLSTIGTAGEKGTGLGLIISKAYVEMQGGKIWVESMPGIGSDFKFTVPR